VNPFRLIGAGCTDHSYQGMRRCLGGPLGLPVAGWEAGTARLGTTPVAGNGPRLDPRRGVTEDRLKKRIAPMQAV
jgi:hypothetical protein